MAPRPVETPVCLQKVDRVTGDVLAVIAQPRAGTRRAMASTFIIHAKVKFSPKRTTNCRQAIFPRASAPARLSITVQASIAAVASVPSILVGIDFGRVDRDGAVECEDGLRSPALFIIPNQCVVTAHRGACARQCRATYSMESTRGRKSRDLSMPSMGSCRIDQLDRHVR
jgi:hypothetical protein